MFLAEALIERKVLSNQINDLIMLIEDNAVIQEGDDDPNISKMLTDLHDMHGRHAHLDKSIRMTNANTNLSDGMSLMEAIAERDSLKFKASTFSNLVGRGYGRAMNRRVFRKSASEVRFTDMLDRNRMAEKRDEYAKASRELDAQIQARNWSIQVFD